MASSKTGSPMVSVVIPAYNAERCIEKVLDAIFEQTLLPAEVILVDDGSQDTTLELAKKWEEAGKIKVITQKNSGAAAATNEGIQNASGDFICLIDSDAVIEPDWIEEILKEFNDPEVAASAGSILTLNKDSLWAKIMGYDLEYRYWRIKSKYTKHLSTCAVIYRKEALTRVGLFNTALKYGYDNDMSYRIGKAGYKLVLQKGVKVFHRWRDTFKGYFKQQLNVSYATLQVIGGEHPDMKFGDEVANVREFIHVPVTLVILLSLILGIVWGPSLLLAAALLFILFLERLWESVSIYKEKKDIQCLVTLPFIHIFIRNVAWVFSLVKFAIGKGKQIFGRLRPFQKLKQ